MVTDICLLLNFSITILIWYKFDEVSAMNLTNLLALLYLCSYNIWKVSRSYMWKIHFKTVSLELEMWVLFAN